MADPRKRAGLPIPDRSRPGKWIYPTRESDPTAFRNTEEERQEAAAAYAASDARLRQLQECGDNALFEAAAAAGSEQESEQEVLEPDDEGDSTYQPSPERRQKKGKARQSVQVVSVLLLSTVGDALPIHHDQSCRRSCMHGEGYKPPGRFGC